MNFTEFDSLFQRINTSLLQIGGIKRPDVALVPPSVVKLTDHFTSCINNTRCRLINKVRQFQENSLGIVTTESAHPTTKLVFKPSELTVENIRLLRINYTNEFDLHKKIRYSSFMPEPFEIVPLDEKYFDQRGRFGLYQLTRDKLIVHSKADNLIQLYLRTLHAPTYSTLIRQLQVERNSFLTLHVYNAQLIVRSRHEKASVLNLYDEYLNLIR